MARVFIALIRIYQRFLSPMLGRNCRFVPSCSQYAIDALRLHGLFKGSLFAAYRLLRCQPLCKGGEDPVPAPRATLRN